MEKRKKKAKKISAVLFSFPQYTWSLSMCIQNLKTDSSRSCEICNKNVLGEKEKWTNIRNDKQQHAASLLHNTHHLYQISKS